MLEKILVCAAPAVFLVITSVFSLIDGLRTETEKRKLHDRLYALWFYLDNLKLPNLPQATGQWVTRLFQYLNTSNRQRIIGGLVFATLSFLITVLSFPIGALFSRPSVAFDPLLILKFANAWQTAALIAAGFVSHGVGLVCTYLLSAGVRDSRSALYAIGLVALYIFVWFLIAEKAFGIILAVFHGFDWRYFYIAARYLFQSGFWIESLYAAAFLAIVLSYYAALFVLMTSTLALRAAHSLLRRFAHIEVEKEPLKVAPLATLNLFVAVVAATAGLACVIAKFLV